MMTSADIRQQFLDFFASKKHQIVPSAPIVVKNDPTLLFTNAGMNQFKDYFLGSSKAEYSRVADTQKCLRVSGKHNDLEEVGVDTYHHTMFEMLGNWSFGDPARPAGGYFKKEAIAWSWHLLTEVYQLDPEKLYVTIFEGDAKENLPRDEEAWNEWRKVIPEDRIINGNKKDNFWEMGDSGPCGPCTEIHVDCRTEEEREAVPGRSLVNNDHPQVLEIWNNVFIQYNRLKDGSLEPLPAKHVDTGMGLERLVRVLQGKQSNYDTDVFSATISATGAITGKKYDGGDSKQAVAFRVLADHIRAISFAIADGQLPANTGAGYVIRRILRRAVRYYYSYLDYKQPLLYQLVPLLAKQFENVFPELLQQLDFVTKVVKEEEDAFLRTLDKGLKRIDDIIANPATANTNQIEGKAAFELFDTYGFPIDLTKLIAAENNMGIDEAGFEAEMQQQKSRSRAATVVDAEDWVILKDNTDHAFSGYELLEQETKVTRYRKIKAKGKEMVQLVLESTPFYAESGGQTGDTGMLSFEGERVAVIDTRKENNLIIQFAEKLPVNITAVVTATVDPSRRHAIALHHSATHLLHAALRKVLGNHVAQKGSLVNEDYLRFDFSHFSKLNAEELQLVASLVNEKIRQNIPVVIREMNKEEAVAMGAMALFGEKYANSVRVVIIDPEYSIELCGGTHVAHTGELGFFKISHETAVAAGVRRIEAMAGTASERLLQEEGAQIQLIREALRNPKEPLKAIEQLVTENNELRKRMESLEARQLQVTRKELLQQVITIQGISFLGSIVNVSHPDALKKLCFELKTDLNHYLVVLAANIEGKAQVVILLDDTVCASTGLEAPKIIKEQVTPLIKGGGGGQKTLATAGGTDASNLNQVIEQVKLLLG